MCPVTPEETAGLDPVVSNEQSVTVSEAQSFPNSGGEHVRLASLRFTVHALNHQRTPFHFL